MAAIPEIVRDGVTGLLARRRTRTRWRRDRPAGAGAGAALGHGPGRRHRVAEVFGAERGVARLAGQFGLAAAAGADAEAAWMRVAFYAPLKAPTPGPLVRPAGGAGVRGAC